MRTRSSAGSARRWGEPELADDARFATHLARGENQEELEGIIAEWAGRHDADEIDRVLNEAGVICGPIYTIADIFEDPQFRPARCSSSTTTPSSARTSAQAIVPKLSETPGRGALVGAVGGGQPQPRGLRRAARALATTSSTS